MAPNEATIAEGRSCGAHLTKLVDELTSTYFYRLYGLNPRHRWFRNRIISEVKQKIPNLEEAQIEDIDILVYEILRTYEVHRDKKPPLKAYGLWASAWSAPLITTAISYHLIPPELVPVVTIVSTYLSGKLLEPLGSVVQEQWNARLKTMGSSRPSVFRDNRSANNQYLSGLNDRVTGAQSPWAEAGDGKGRAIEADIREGLKASSDAYRDGEIDRSVRFARDVAVDYLVRWSYLSPREEFLLSKIQTYLMNMDQSFRDKLQKEILSLYDLEKRPELTLPKVVQLLNAWLPHTLHTN